MDSLRKRRKSKGNEERELDLTGIGDRKEKDLIENERGFGLLPLSIFLVFFVFLAYVSQHLHFCLPEPLEPDRENTRFSEIRAFPILQELSDFGPKPAGSEACEGKTKGRILEEIKRIKSSIKTKDLLFQIETQNPSGCFSLPRHDTDGFSICYKNVSNVIVRLGDRSHSNGSEISVLLNCHYDSWPTSSAGADDLSSCALMIELIRIFSDHPQYLHHDLIFLFNGAEESSLLASHGFITSHKWRHSIRAFINLEASGSGGRELLFQAGPSNEWLLNSYLEAAIHPHCSVLGQEIFQSGAYPGDTDYRIFRDYGRIPGLDVAFVQNGYWWHTEFDEAKRITPGALQRAGENVLSTLKHLLSSPYLSHPAEFADEKSVFFDFLGLFVVVYPLNLANSFNFILIFIVFSKLGLKIFSEKDPSKSLLIEAIIWNFLFLGFLFLISIKIAFMIEAIFGQMIWYSSHYVVIAFYGLPLIISSLLFSTFISSKFNRNQEIFVSSFEFISDLFLSIILLFLTYKNIASSYLIFFQLLPTLSTFIPQKLIPRGQTITRLLLSIPSICLSLYTSALLLSIFIPIMGRTSRNPEPLVLAFVAFGVIPVIRIMFSVSLLSKPSSLNKISTYLSIFSLLWLSWIGFSRNGSPYRFQDSYPMMKRIQLYHVNRELYDMDGSLMRNESLLYSISHDDRGAQEIPFVERDQQFMPIECIYPSAPYCEIPFYYPVRGRIKEKHIRYKKVERFETKTKEEDSKIEIIKKSVTGSQILYKLRLKGSSQISAYVTSIDGYKITNSSMIDQTENDDEIEEDSRNMFLYFTCSGEKCGDWIIDIQLTGEKETNIDERPLLIGVTSHFLHGSNMKSSLLRSIEEEIMERRGDDPRWAITASAWNVHLLYRYL